ncbi:MAG: hypothetical protein IKJ93_03960, partial [Clostridia bacterium]|nr:hypothetical protein [Clostridia bacterium]
MKTLKKKIISLVLTLTFLMSVFTPLTAFAEGGNSVIETVNLTDFVIPSVGDQAVKNPSCTVESGKGYTYSSSMFFYKNNQFTSTFQGAETYTVKFNLNAEDGYEFAPTGTLTATVNGGDVAVKSVKVGAQYRGSDYATVEAEFTMPDLREEVSEFVGTSNMGAITYGADVKDSYDFSFTVGTQAYVTSSMGDWEKWNETASAWEEYNEVKFTEGKYRYSNQLRIDGNNGKTHKLAATGVVRIDGAAWEYDEDPWIEPTYSYTYITSPEFTVEKAAIPLEFTDNNLYNIGINYIDTAITPYSVLGGVMGGTEPYVFSKTSGPEWVTVAADGTVSGTPTALGENSELVIRVTDAESNYKEITVYVNNTYCKPEDRITVSEFEATSNMPAIAFGTEVEDSYDFVFTVGTQAYITSSMGYWEKWNESLSAWEEYQEDIFTLGKYRYSNQLRIDGNNGKTHKLAETCTVTIDGAAWEYGEDPWIEPTYSYTYITSPEFEVGLPEVVNQIELNNVIIPAAGDSASTAPTCTIEGKADLSVAKYFYDNVEFNSVFESCKTYTIRFNLIAEPGYKFETAENLSVTVNGGAFAVKKISVAAQYRNNDSATVEIEFNLHSPAFVSGKASGCTTDGWEDYYDCDCGKHFEDAAATTEITDLDDWKIGDGKIAAGHTYGALIEAKPEVHTQTKLEASVAAHYFCDVCDTYFTESKVATTLQALTGTVPSHNYANKYAYKTDDGHADTCSCGAHNAVVNHKYTNACDGDCNDCGKTRTPAAHQYDNACDKTCNVCKATRTIKHTYKKVVTKATTSKNGKIENKCTVCGDVESTTTIKYAKTFSLSSTSYTYDGKT